MRGAPRWAVYCGLKPESCVADDSIGIERAGRRDDGAQGEDGGEPELVGAQSGRESTTACPAAIMKNEEPTAKAILSG